MRHLILLLMCLLAGSVVTGGQELPPCRERIHSLDQPWVDGSLFCLEEVIHDDSGGELSFTALATAPDGILYATRPLAGQVLALHDTDDEGLPDTPHVVAEGLTLPNGLAYYEDTLYIAGGAHIYRLVGDTFETLVDDLPSDGGFWTGGLAVGPDERLYVAIGASCDFCEPGDPSRGAILSFALDGSDRQLIASGLRQPSDVAFLDGALWTVDTARDALYDAPDLDELNRVVPGAHFGFPYCIGRDNRADLVPADFNCTDAAPPALTFPTHSTPLGLAAYTSNTFPALTGRLLVVLGGSYNQTQLRGLAVIAVSLDTGGNPTDYEVLMPKPPNEASLTSVIWQDIQYSGAGFWPHRPLDVTVNMQGWVYISMSGGRIFALRPR